MIKTHIKKVKFYVTICGGLCHGSWIHSYIKWQQGEGNERDK